MSLDAFIASGEGKPNDVSDFFDESPIRVRRGAAKRLIDASDYVRFESLRRVAKMERQKRYLVVQYEM